ncbi:mannitol dehydrogenase family protein [Neiella sp. HB171785]|uniref:Mannitol dehydrogenase family protein n=1 Tax=Neiella litorisoli TaxID=2771431 RepID=A0A8J6R3Y0_9GAMM|nr:mannitol dehydrogenase family protein [Neiella litorisoli]MBD1390895.1 mannitol dehydrogenase family protein [Neiella litorisoli]
MTTTTEVNLESLGFNEKTSFDRSKLATNIVHIGFGAFHRGHQAVYNDLTNDQSDQLWGICEINMFGGPELIADLQAQDHLFSVVERSADTMVSRLIRSVTESIHTPVDGIQAAIDKLAEPQVKIVSLTITEKGYCSDPQSGQLDINNGLIQHDLANPQTPQSALGLITEALRIRRDRGLAPFSVLSCDNIPENGLLTKEAVLSFAKQLDAELASWIEANVTFPSTMVDRIVPAMTDDAFAVIDECIGYRDPCGIVCEDYRQWVIEDNFVAGRPDWDKAGAMFVADVLPYEEMKLRMLNGSHSFLAYNGFLAGYDFIYQCMEDADFRATTLRLMLEEQAKSLNPNLKVDLEQYASLLIGRFSNPNIKHKTAQIAMDGSQKLPQRAIDPMLTMLERGITPTCQPLLIAGWATFVINAVTNGGDLVDPMAEQLKQAVNSASTAVDQLKALLALKQIFGEHPQSNETFAALIETAFVNLQETGIKGLVHSVSKGTN